jgi:membrane associated rhomboid family serine protease
MKESSIHLYEFILRQCAGVDPNPWYPSSYVPENGISRADLDKGLDDLRLGGLIRLTDWVQGRGQGYALTSEGSQVASSPAVLVKLREWKPAYAQGESEGGIDRRVSDRPTTLERGDAVRAAFTHYSTPWVTRILVLANVVMFGVGICLAVIQKGDLKAFLSWGGEGLILYETGAYSGMALVSGQWWRLIATCFLHAGLLHLGTNMLALYSFGRLAERMFGGPALLVLYLVSGLGGSVAAAIAGPNVGCVGASGAICGIVTAEIAWLLLNRGHLPPAYFGQILASFRNTIVLVILISLVPGVSWQGHLGGAIAGFFAGAALTALRFGSGLQRVLGGVGVIAVTAITVGVLLLSQAVDPRWQELFAERDRRELQHEKYKLAWLLNNAQSSLDDFWRIRKKVQPLLILPAVARDKDTVDNELVDIREQQSKLAEAIRTVSAEKSSNAEIVVKTRENYVALLDALEDFFKLASSTLEGADAWTADKQKELDAIESRRKQSLEALKACRDELEGVPTREAN